MRVGISGHRSLPPLTVQRVAAVLAETLAPYAPEDLVGVSCLATGADQLFARTVLDCGGRLKVIVPARGYRASLPPACQATYDELLAQAAEVRELPFARPTPQAYLAAGLAMLEQVDVLFAVWDGRPARGPGGTAQVVAAARVRGIAVMLLWPPGSRRAP
jgi:hypothetical protein